tara:strand:+ start:2142 stop:2252 length:111 start_codon:yes stop_codon:yes gene_type:complete
MNKKITIPIFFDLILNQYIIGDVHFIYQEALDFFKK